jgi:hypothetical protein
LRLGDDTFARSWTVEVLKQPPLIAPARQFTWPLAIAGEEDAMARGALQLLVRPAAGGIFLATCALGFTDPAMPTGVFGCPNPDEICTVAGGYAYLADTQRPERCFQLPLKPVVEVHALPEHGLLLFAGFQTLAAYGPNGVAWTTGRLTWEGLTLDRIDSGKLFGTGWDMPSNRELPFTVDLMTGEHAGGGYTLP